MSGSGQGVQAPNSYTAAWPVQQSPGAVWAAAGTRRHTGSQNPSAPDPTHLYEHKENTKLNLIKSTVSYLINKFLQLLKWSTWSKLCWKKLLYLIYYMPSFVSLKGLFAQKWKFCRRREELLNKVVVFVFFLSKKYSRSFINYSWTTDVTWTILTMSLLPFWVLNVSVALLSMEGQKALRFHQKYLNLCSEDEQRSYGFGTTWEWVINNRIFIFGWTNPLMPLIRPLSIIVKCPPSGRGKHVLLWNLDWFVMK